MARRDKPARAYETSDVPVHKSREEIDMLLRRWSCTEIAWLDRYPTATAAGRLSVRFVWTWEGIAYAARRELPIPTWGLIVAEYTSPPRPTTEQVQKRLEQRIRAIHRMLLHSLKSSFDEVDWGLRSAVEVLLPYIEGVDGQTIAEAVIPHLRRLKEASATTMIEGGKP